MKSIRISKYNPIYRDKSGSYTKEDWTSISDIGKIFEGSKLALKDYLFIENKYVDLLINILKQNDINSLIVNELEVYEFEKYDSELKIKNDKEYKNYNDIGTIIKLSLRENMWCKLLGRNNFRITFGYDYYVYVDSDNEIEIESKLDEIYVEDYKSPY